MQLFAELARISKYYGGSVSLSTPWLMRSAKITKKTSKKRKYMIQQGFYITKEIPDSWWFMVYYNISTSEELEKVYGALLAAGAGQERAQNAREVLSRPNSGYIFTSTADKSTVICISHADSYDELFDSITHEIDHATAHICEYYNIPCNSEKSAYIQGEIGKNMYKAVALSICPKCNCGKH